jgi:hypothetical protein
MSLRLSAAQLVAAPVVPPVFELSSSLEQALTERVKRPRTTGRTNTEERMRTSKDLRVTSPTVSAGEKKV